MDFLLRVRDYFSLVTYIECILDVAKYQYLLKGDTHIPNVILLPLQFC